jgi:hypothetical protein
MLAVAVNKRDAANSGEGSEYRKAFEGKPAFSAERHRAVTQNRVAVLQGIITELVRDQPIPVIFDESARQGIPGIVISTPRMLFLAELTAPHELVVDSAVILAHVQRMLAMYGINHEQIVASVTDCAPVMKRALREGGLGDGRVFSKGRYVCDYYQGGCKDVTIADRLFCKVNKRLPEPSLIFRWWMELLEHF